MMIDRKSMEKNVLTIEEESESKNVQLFNLSTSNTSSSILNRLRGIGNISMFNV